MTTQPTPEPPENESEVLRIRAILERHLRETVFCCTRVWEAWSVGTMGEDDFNPAWENDELLDGLARELAEPARLNTLAPASGGTAETDAFIKANTMDIHPMGPVDMPKLFDFARSLETRLSSALARLGVVEKERDEAIETARIAELHRSAMSNTLLDLKRSLETIGNNGGHSCDYRCACDSLRDKIKGHEQRKELIIQAFASANDRKIMDTLRAELSALRAERDGLKKSEAVCHCGEVYSAHRVYSTCNNFVEMKETCPYAEDLHQLRTALAAAQADGAVAALEELRDVVLNGRGPLEAMLNNDQTNAVLACIDDATSAAQKPEGQG